uniref:DUF4283 domain-containing protein n=1 Tax=Cannabis sativa TaxID=3483 RepID=A0A803P2H8_CANSA
MEAYTTTFFWIQVYRLSFLSKSETLAQVISNLIGSFIDVHEDSLNEGWGLFLRIRVAIDVSKPLLRGKTVTFPWIADKLWLEYRKLASSSVHTLVVNGLKNNVANVSNASGRPGNFSISRTKIRSLPPALSPSPIPKEKICNVDAITFLDSLSSYVALSIPTPPTNIHVSSSNHTNTTISPSQVEMTHSTSIAIELNTSADISLAPPTSQC